MWKHDVVILGLGGAGTCAAIEAADAGARVIVLEKAAAEQSDKQPPQSGGIFHCPDRRGTRRPEGLCQGHVRGETFHHAEGEQPDVSTALAEAWARFHRATLTS